MVVLNLDSIGTPMKKYVLYRSLEMSETTHSQILQTINYLKKYSEIKEKNPNFADKEALLDAVKIKDNLQEGE